MLLNPGTDREDIHAFLRFDTGHWNIDRVHKHGRSAVAKLNDGETAANTGIDTKHSNHGRPSTSARAFSRAFSMSPSVGLYGNGIGKTWIKSRASIVDEPSDRHFHRCSRFSNLTDTIQALKLPRSPALTRKAIDVPLPTRTSAQGCSIQLATLWRRPFQLVNSKTL